MEQADPKVLQALFTYKMPFGKYKGRNIADLPGHYLEWFARQGFPKGKLGMMLSTMHEIKQNGLEQLIEPLRPR